VEHAAGGPIRHRGKGGSPSAIVNAVTALQGAASNTNVRQPLKHPRGSLALPGLEPNA
jgi:hypothetical protein